MNEMEMTKQEYREDRFEAYSELSGRLGHMIRDLQQLKEKVDWAKQNNVRINIDTVNIAMFISSMMLMNNEAARISKDNEVLMALGDTK